MADYNLIGLDTATSTGKVPGIADTGVVKGNLTVEGTLTASVIDNPNYQGTWNASTNTPTLTSATGTQGHWYLVSVAGSTTLDGISTWNVGDVAIYNGAAWQRVENMFADVTSFIGTAPNELPLNQYLGGMAFQSPESVVIKPQATAVPNGIGDMTFQATSDSVIEMEYKGSDAVVRTAQIPLSNERLAMLSRVTPLRQAVRVAMTAAASGSNGIQVLDNANVRFGTGNFSIHWEGSLPDYTPASNQNLYVKSSGVTNVLLGIYSAGTMRMFLNQVEYASTVATGLTDGVAAKLSVVVTRESASVAGSVVFYVNGFQLGAAVAIPAGTPGTTDFAVSAYISGSSAARNASDTTNAIIYNRALSAAEVLSLSVNGPALADLGASQTAVFTSDFSAGTNSFAAVNGTVAGNIDGIGGLDDWLRLTLNTTNAGHATQRTFSTLSSTRYRVTFTYFIPSSNSNANNIRLQDDNGIILSSTIFSSLDAATTVSVDITTGTTATWGFYALDDGAAVFQDAGGDDVIYIRNVIITRIGITGQWNAEDAQSDTGQIIDRSGNGSHALLPAAGATVIPPRNNDCKVRGKLTWTASSTAQDVVGVNQAIIPVNGVWQPTFMIRSSGSITVNIGDGVDADRYGAAVVLAAGVNIVTPLLRTHDGTNRRLVITPTGSSTATINVLAKYDIVEAV